MSAVTRKKKEAKLRAQVGRRDAIVRLTGKGGMSSAELIELVERNIDRAWLPWRDGRGKPISFDPTEDPWEPNKRNGTKRKLRASWEHLRPYLPDINKKTTWSRLDRQKYELLVHGERYVRKKATSARRCWDWYLSCTDVSWRWEAEEVLREL